MFYPVGNHETEVCCEGKGEADIQNLACKKNPGHKEFIPVTDFNISCLPLRYREDHLMLETIKTLAALTVQVKTTFTSPKRPEFYPGTQVPYPFYNNTRSLTRLGTGRVCGVRYSTESDGCCKCAKCRDSATPNKVLWEIRVVTTRHVVFDDSEAEQTRCVLGFDDDSSSVFCLDGWKVWMKSTMGDRCKLMYITCDLDLAVKLDKLYKHFVHLCGEVDKKYMKDDYADNLAVIVSHPHGCPKQVSVGQWTHKHQERGSYLTRYTYTTCTCPGSSGAPVYKPGHAGWSSHPHSGSYCDGNYSGDAMY